MLYCAVVHNLNLWIALVKAEMEQNKRWLQKCIFCVMNERYGERNVLLIQTNLGQQSNFFYRKVLVSSTTVFYNVLQPDETPI